MYITMILNFLTLTTNVHVDARIIGTHGCQMIIGTVQTEKGEPMKKVYDDILLITRCKDCIYWKDGDHMGDPDGLGSMPFCDFWKSEVYEDDFCSYAERKANESD
jgi:hypothetical protein